MKRLDSNEPRQQGSVMRKSQIQGLINCRGFLTLALLFAVIAGATPTWGQGSVGSYPNLNYYAAYGFLRDGNLEDAADGFESAGRSGKRTVRGAWIDSVCYRTMIGECQYRAGRLPAAIQNYDAALQLFLLNAGWMTRVDFGQQVLRPTTRQVRPPVNWASRPIRLAEIPNRFQVAMGRTDNINVVRQGGVIEPPQIISANVHEIARCIALALRRRFEILGPVGKYDPLTSKLTAAFDANLAPVNHWSRAWVNAQRGYALACAGKAKEAERAFKSAVLVGGQYDHPLTATAQMGLGQLALLDGQPEEAVKHFIDASASAAIFEQFELVEDAFQWASDSHLSLGKKELLKQLSPAATYAQRQRLRHLRAVLLTLATENLANVGRGADAGRMLGQSRKSIERRNTMSAQLLARNSLIESRLLYQKGKLTAAEETFARAIAQQKNVSPWLFQIAMTDRLYLARKGGISPRNASNLFTFLLREPTRMDWTLRPLDTFSFILTPNRPAYEHWFEIALDRGESELALEIGDQMRRRTFYSQLPLGGRLLSLRWLLESPESVMSDEHVELRTDLLTRYPALKKLVDQSASLRDKLAALPIAEATEEELQQQKELGDQIEAVTATQEALLGDIALRREYSPFLFPPSAKTEDIQSSLKDKQLALVYIATSRGLHAFMLSNQEYGSWKMPETAELRKQMGQVFRSFGLTSENGSVPPERLDDSWKTIGVSVRRKLIDRAQEGFWNTFDELLIVPDGRLWYMPFEALPVEDGDEIQPLLSKIRIRYLPTAGMIPFKGMPAKRNPRTAVVTGKLFPKDDLSLAVDHFESMSEVVENMHRVPDRPAASTGLLRNTWDRLLVLDDIPEARETPFQWSPGRVDAGRPGSMLARWMRLPWGGPRQILLPGFHTATEASLKRKRQTGDEIFVATMGMMATGADTILLSRWRTGGMTCFDLMQEFLQEESGTTPAAAWQRSVHVLGETEVDPDWEPRIGRSKKSVALTASHPFFWAGYMLIDVAGNRTDSDNDPSELEEPDPEADDTAVEETTEVAAEKVGDKADDADVDPKG
ncbi:MAG: tetratricopeptide repeat protein [Planctomycetota bacterium]